MAMLLSFSSLEWLNERDLITAVLSNNLLHCSAYPSPIQLSFFKSSLEVNTRSNNTNTYDEGDDEDSEYSHHSKGGRDQDQDQDAASDKEDDKDDDDDAVMKDMDAYIKSNRYRSASYPGPVPSSPKKAVVNSSIFGQQVKTFRCSICLQVR